MLKMKLQHFGHLVKRAESESEITQSCPTLCDPMDCSLPGSSVHGIFQAIVLEWIVISLSRGSSQPRDQTGSPILYPYCRQTLYRLSHQGSPRFWCWERLKAKGEGDDGGLDGWMASPIQWTGVWASFGRWWSTGKPGVLLSMESQKVGHNWATELNWTEPFFLLFIFWIFLLLVSSPQFKLLQ